MRRPRKAACLGLAAAALAIAPLAAMRVPERTLERTNSFQWLPDVRERLKILEEHGADAARERSNPIGHEISPGRFTPQPPAAGDERAR
jgi:hypothetical protein